MDNNKIEYVARAFYDADEDAQIWDREPEILKEEFRRYAREAIALLAQQSEDGRSKMGEFKLRYAA